MSRRFFSLLLDDSTKGNRAEASFKESEPFRSTFSNITSPNLTAQNDKFEVI